MTMTCTLSKLVDIQSICSFMHDEEELLSRKCCADKKVNARVILNTTERGQPSKVAHA